jgi:hypothetical protein
MTWLMAVQDSRSFFVTSLKPSDELFIIAYEAHGL